MFFSNSYFAASNWKRNLFFTCVLNLFTGYNECWCLYRKWTIVAPEIFKHGNENKTFAFVSTFRLQTMTLAFCASLISIEQLFFLRFRQSCDTRLKDYSMIRFVCRWERQKAFLRKKKFCWRRNITFEGKFNFHELSWEFWGKFCVLNFLALECCNWVENFSKHFWQFSGFILGRLKALTKLKRLGWTF